jgi:transcriptional regulator with PAS, ATPase and Fis domain
MNAFNEYDDFSAAVTVCDAQGIVLYMNPASAAMLKKRGGESLVGRSLFDCHNAASNEIIRRLIKEGESNIYFTEKPGKKTIVYQSPWYLKGGAEGGAQRVGGLVEISFQVPEPARVVKRG